MKLGILDFGEVDVDSNGVEAIYNTINNCQISERKGYSRYWLSEHYTNTIAWRNADIILTLLAGYTERIKIGSAGVKLDLYKSSFDIAQNYKILSSLFENRIDLGFAKGFETKEVMDVICDAEVKLNSIEKIEKIIKMFNNEFRSVPLVPLTKSKTDFWMLGTSESMVNFIIENKLNFSLSLFHNTNSPIPDAEIIADLKTKFFDKNGYYPQINIAISVFCHSSKKRIKKEIANRKNVELNVFGNPIECRDKIKNLLEKYHSDEAIILNLGENQEEKLYLIENLIE